MPWLSVTPHKTTDYVQRTCGYALHIWEPRQVEYHRFRSSFGYLHHLESVLPVPSELDMKNTGIGVVDTRAILRESALTQELDNQGGLGLDGMGGG
jgi:hypothetical protein